VFKCRSKEDGKYYAIKKSREPFRGQCDRKRKMEEVAKHEELLPHPNCIRFYKAWEERGHLYIQTELCQMSVSEFCNKNHHLIESLIWNYLVDLLMV
ncbi:membrane-associated tyrosine-and threonine-specific cdc2-inhibitory kinase, partial [Plakobranchus ocellatus]